MNNSKSLKKAQKSSVVQLPNGFLSRTPLIPFLLVTILFPMWGSAQALNDILITQFKTVFQLNDAATAFVQGAFYGGYFLIAIPTSIVIKRSSYKLAILTGLVCYIIGCGMFFPASQLGTYTMFLAALFAIAVGLSFLETSCDAYITMMGPKDKSDLRISFSQVFVPIGEIIGILLGKFMIFSEVKNLSATMAKLHGAARIKYGEQMLQLTLRPYKYILVALLVIFVLILVTKMPKAKVIVDAKTSQSRIGVLQGIKYLAQNRRYMMGVFMQFLYVGVQTTVWSFTIRLALEVNKTISDSAASDFMIISYIVFFLGRLSASALIARFKPLNVLAGYVTLGAVSVTLVALLPNMSAVWMAVIASFFFGPGWPTIYSTTQGHVKNKQYTEIAGAFLVMAIIGGAVIPIGQGIASDALQSLQLSFLFPAACYAVVAIYYLSQALRNRTQK